MSEFIKQVTQITSQYKLLAYAIAALLLLVSIVGRRTLAKSRAWLSLIVLCIVMLSVSPTILPMVSDKIIGHASLYRITITVLKVDGTRILDAVVSSDVPSSKVINNSVIQLEITPAHLPANKTITLMATDPSGAFTGSKEITLGSDMNPNFQIKVDRIGTILSGNVFARDGNPLSGVMVTIRGAFPGEKTTTDQLGSFQFKTHIAEGQLLWVIATKGKRTAEQQHIAGDDPVRIQF